MLPLSWVITGLIGIGLSFSSAEGILLHDVTSQTGISFTHCDGATGLYRIAEGVASGLALFDYDNDQDIDIYFLSGAYAPGSAQGNTPRNALYRNNGDWTFTDVAQEAGVGDTGFGLGVAAADYDNDGDIDLYVNNYGPNVLYRNNGDGSFTDVTRQAGVANGARMGAGANFLDVDADGDLDLFVSSYVEYAIEKHVPSTTHGHPVYPGPSLYPSAPDALFRNNGDGSFSDISQQAGIQREHGPGMGTVCVDYDGDGDTDVLVANDARANFLFQNDGTGRFEEVGLLMGMAFDMHGETQGSMGVEAGDYDNDGWLDLYLTSYQNESALLLRNLEGLVFEDVTRATGAGLGTLPDVTWGVGLADFDNDGDRDIFVACGHIQDRIELFDDRSTYLQANRLYMNMGQSRFTDVSRTSGDGLQIIRCSRGAGFDDLDNDGDVDVVILNSRSQPTILRNDSSNQGHWLQIRLRGTQANRDGVGAQVKVVTSDLTLLDEVRSGRSYQSHFGTRLYFGLGQRTEVDRIEVRWPGGATDTYRNIKVDQRILLEQGRSEASPWASQREGR